MNYKGSFEIEQTNLDEIQQPINYETKTIEIFNINQLDNYKLAQENKKKFEWGKFLCGVGLTILGGVFAGVGFTIGGSALIKWRNHISQAKEKSEQIQMNQ